ncbi:hypothetical protein TcasGA2_TC012255 [Tribolium castaneum]|uniref:Uncharacterized protein n=1 Tax=Tribolium castaneum TaxID=7070 RepID=D6X066_TRICA|nr:hypothetical protein TcasGA2_TC012255 [Tribolium castaneum]
MCAVEALRRREALGVVDGRVNGFPEGDLAILNLNKNQQDLGTALLLRLFTSRCQDL